MTSVISQVCTGRITRFTAGASGEGTGMYKNLLNKPVSTGMFKKPRQGPVAVDQLGLEGDQQADLVAHGGENKAVYVYPQVHYEYWQQFLGQSKLEEGQFAENLTVTELDESNVRIGDTFRAGSVLLKVTQPRMPCGKLGLRMQRGTFPKVFLDSGRLGFYCRVEEHGVLQRGDNFVLVGKDSNGISLYDFWKMTKFKNWNPELAAKALDCLPHLDDFWRHRLNTIVSKKQ